MTEQEPETDSAALARAMRELRRVFPGLVVLGDYPTGLAAVTRIGPNIIDARAIASGKRRPKNLGEYRAAQQAVSRTTTTSKDPHATA